MKNLPDIIELKLKAKHFAGTEYVGCGHCAIDKAFIDQMEVIVNPDVEGEGVFCFRLGLVTWLHPEYDEIQFEADKKKASQCNPDETIRTITLTRQPNND